MAPAGRGEFAGLGGLRLGEQNGLRAIDVFFGRGYVHVNGSWITPRRLDGFRGAVKNDVIHEVPFLSITHARRTPAAGQGTSRPLDHRFIAAGPHAQGEERQRRAKVAARDADETLAWWNYPVPPFDE